MVGKERKAHNRRGPIVDPQVQAYLGTLHGEADPLLDALERHAKEQRFPLLGRESGHWIELLSRMIGARRVFEFGSGWGYSAHWFARAVGPEGAVHGAEKDAHELEAHAKLFAGHPHRKIIHIEHGDAAAIFASLPGDFDVVFIDMNKEGYLDALELAVPRVRVGGLILADNVLWGGRTARPATDAATEALQAYNRATARDSRLQTCILPSCDGLSVSLRVG
jgi:caffeoyl-CoA O-methyltransferase